MPLPIIRARQPRTDDTEMIRLIRTELIPFSYTVSPHDAWLIRELPRRLQRGGTIVASLSRTAPPLAFVHYEVMGEVLYIDMLVTNPAYRNRNWGKRLMAKCEADGIAQQCTVARLFVDQSNGKAQHFYKKLGYSPIRYYEELRCYEMLKPLIAQQQAINY